MMRVFRKRRFVPLGLSFLLCVVMTILTSVTSLCNPSRSTRAGAGLPASNRPDKRYRRLKLMVCCTAPIPVGGFSDYLIVYTDQTNITTGLASLQDTSVTGVGHRSSGSGNVPEPGSLALVH
jgi:hypothetical protein